MECEESKLFRTLLTALCEAQTKVKVTFHGDV